MAIRDMVEKGSDFEEDIKKWKDLEDVTIESCDKIIGSSSNALVKTVAGIIKADSHKHKEILNVIEDALNGTILLSPEELGAISELLDNHLKLEKNSVMLAEKELENSRHFVIRHLLSYLLEDERKHVKLLNQLNDFKRHLYPYA
ncbi:MAG: hypothetical protein K6T91_04325 [Firmicutes bacterium]|nr:hypothetical protein [Bacillota bacterium]